MTSDERFEHIEKSLQTAVDITNLILESQLRLQETVSGLAASVARYLEAADARMKRLEENLDGLIRAITAEHSNGKQGR